MAISKIKTGSIADSAVTTTKISDGTIVNADISPSAAIAANKTVICTSITDTNTFNISLLGFKMAVNEGLTVFNLIDGVVDEFHDESGTDEAEGSNDHYDATNDLYTNNASATCVSAGFTMTSVTEEDTSEAGNNPTQGTATSAVFTVPLGMTSMAAKVWGGGGGHAGNGNGGGGGFVSGTVAVTPGQSIYIVAGEGALGGNGSTPGGPTSGGVKGGAVGGGNVTEPCNAWGGGGGGAGLVSTDPYGPTARQAPSPRTVSGTVLVAAGGGGGANQGAGGAGGGLTGDAGDTSTEQTNAEESNGGGGDQEQGGQGGSTGSAQSGAFLYGGNGAPVYGSGGGSGFFGGGGGGSSSPQHLGGGGGSSYYGNPAVTSGATEEGNLTEGGGVADPAYVAGTNEGVVDAPGEDGYVLLTGSGTSFGGPGGGATTIISNAFTSTTVPTSSRIVVFEENVDSPTLNTDIIASVSRDNGSTYTAATLADSGYVTGSSGQRILTGQATISGQPSGQSMRWKLALANNTVKIHGVSLQWA